MFDTSNEDKSELCVGCTKSLTTGAWTYTSAEDIWGIPIVGHYNTYSGGGYIQKPNTKLRLIFVTGIKHSPTKMTIHIFQ
jgi:membrane peptidoglycan carboxypeptidase